MAINVLMKDAFREKLENKIVETKLDQWGLTSACHMLWNKYEGAELKKETCACCSLNDKATSGYLLWSHKRRRVSAEKYNT